MVTPLLDKLVVIAKIFFLIVTIARLAFFMPFLAAARTAQCFSKEVSAYYNI